MMKKKSGKNGGNEFGYSIDDFKPATELEAVKGFKLAIFGADKSGKTYFTLAPDADIIFVIDSEGNSKSISKQFSEEHQAKLKIKDVDIKDEDGHVDLISAPRKLEALVDVVYEYAIAHPDENGIIVIDSISEYWEWLSYWLEHQKDLVRTKTGKMVQTEWGRVNRPHAETIGKLKATGWDIIVTGKAQPVYGDGGQRLDVNDAKWQKGIPYWADVTGELVFDGVTTKFRMTSNRYGRFLDVIEEPTYEKIKEHISKRAGVKFD